VNRDNCEVVLSDFALITTDVCVNVNSSYIQSICSRQATGGSGDKTLATSRQLSDWFRLGGLLAVVDSSSSTDYPQVRDISIQPVKTIITTTATG